MTAIEQLKRELVLPIVPGDAVPPILQAGGGAIAPGLVHIILELIERVERLEARLEGPV